ncbi:MAG: hypothetical protein HYT78_21050 [Deltaproteobacteria bacterium]|nr:hypothetical protein [Deltaproteobacteria bacterium]
MEQELTQLKADQARANQEQMELKREATAAAAALPTFTYRPGRGVTIGAADRAWSMEMNYELMVVMYNHLDGNDARGATTGDLHFRRNRPMWIFNFNNALYEWGIGLDLDTGQQATGSTNATNSIQQNQWFKVRFQNMNPYFPEFQIGDNTSGPYGGTLSMSVADRSSHSSAILESLFDMLSDSDSQRLGRRAMHLIWRQMPIGRGDFSFSAEYKMGAGVAGSFLNNQLSDTDRKQLATQLHVRPFSRSKNYWTEGLITGVTLETDSVDTRSSVRGRRIRVRSAFERVGAQTILDSGTTIGGGNHNHWTTGLGWRLGPYFAAVQGEWANYEDKAEPGITSLKGPRGNAWRIWHELFLWSPKGPLTGTAATPGSVQAGWAFARANADCGKGLDCAPGTGSYNSVHLINRELGLYYYLRSQMRVGVNWYYWTSSNTPLTVQQAIGCTTRAADVGKECNWHTINLVLNANF